jgi:hypothetical protein
VGVVDEAVEDGVGILSAALVSAFHSSEVDPKATLRGRARSELAAVLGAVTRMLHIRGTNWVFFSDEHCYAPPHRKGSGVDRRLSIPPSWDVGERPRRAGVYRAPVPDFGQRSNQAIDLLIGM